MFVPNLMKIERGPDFFLLIWYGMTHEKHWEEQHSEISTTEVHNTCSQRVCIETLYKMCGNHCKEPDQLPHLKHRMYAEDGEINIETGIDFTVAFTFEQQKERIKSICSFICSNTRPFIKCNQTFENRPCTSYTLSHTCKRFKLVIFQYQDGISCIIKPITECH